MNIFKGETIYLRLLEPGDCENTIKWRNDFNMQKMTCGPMRYISKEMEKNWAQSKSLDNQHDIYLAVCNIENDRMIGYTSINEMNFINRSCTIGGIVIGDNEYRDGTALLEIEIMLLDYIFNELNMYRIFGSCLKTHKMTIALAETFFYTFEGTERSAVYKNGKYHDVLHISLLRDEYYEHEKVGDYKMEKCIRRLVKSVKRDKA